MPAFLLGPGLALNGVRQPTRTGQVMQAQSDTENLSDGFYGPVTVCHSCIPALTPVTLLFSSLTFLHPGILESQPLSFLPDRNKTNPLIMPQEPTEKPPQLWFQCCLALMERDRDTGLPHTQSATLIYIETASLNTFS